MSQVSITFLAWFMPNSSASGMLLSEIIIYLISRYCSRKDIIFIFTFIIYINVFRHYWPDVCVNLCEILNCETVYHLLLIGNTVHSNTSYLQGDCSYKRQQFVLNDCNHWLRLNTYADYFLWWEAEAGERARLAHQAGVCGLCRRWWADTGDTLGLGTLGTVRLGPACTAHVSPVSLQQGQNPPTINIFQR